MVDISPVAQLEIVSLAEIKENQVLEGMPLIQRGQRLSVQPVSVEHFNIICEMGGIDAEDIEV
jgi:predicted RNA-binding protein with PUA-like domain